jgi:SAM-dependent methyltransferase
VGIDLADRLLDRAREKALQQGLSNLEFQQADMENLGYPDGSFDAVVSVFSVFFVPDMTKQVAELWRMVKPGGQLAITTWGPRAFEPGASSFWAAVKDHAPPALHFGASTHGIVSRRLRRCAICWQVRGYPVQWSRPKPHSNRCGAPMIGGRSLSVQASSGQWIRWGRRPPNVSGATI